MTATSGPMPQGKSPGFDRLATRLAHWTPALFLLGGTLYMGSIWLTVTLANGWPWWQGVLLASAIAIPGGMVIALAFLVTGWHLYALCPVCARKTPLDPTKAVAKKRRTLRALHWLADKHPKASKWTPLVLLILSFTPWVGQFFFFALFAWFAYTVLLMQVHMPLQPWCPQCRGGWGKGGPEEKVPTPDPTTSGVLT